MGTDLDRLRARTAQLGPGPIPSDVRDLIAAAWDELDGGDEQAMAARKVDRVEKLEWNPPYLTFVIERHGGTVHGSKRSEMQGWTVDVTEGTAKWELAGYRQLSPNAEPWNRAAAAKAVEEIAEVVRNGLDDQRVVWTKDRKRFRVATSHVFPPGPKQTTQGRTKRLAEALADVLGAEGWTRTRSWWQRDPQ